MEDFHKLVEHLSSKLNQYEVSSLGNAVVGVGYSGGRDSLLLLETACACLGPTHVLAIWIDHGLRSVAERAQERIIVEKNAKNLGVSLKILGPPDVPFSSKGNIEAQARDFRMTCFEKVYKSESLKYILLAHHKDDVAETVLMRLMQGRSWNGLAGIQEQRGIFLRPFLEVSRNDINRILSNKDIQWSEDSTNLSVQPLRNKIRLELMPQLEKIFPRAKDSLVEFSHIWAQYVPTGFDSQKWIKTSAGWKVNAKVWFQWSLLERENQIFSLWNKSGETGRLARKFLETFIELKYTSQVQGCGWEFKVTDDWIYWEQVAQTRALGYFIIIDLDRWYQLPQGNIMVSENNMESGSFPVPCLTRTKRFVIRSLREGENCHFYDGQSCNRSWKKKHPSVDLGLFENGNILALLDLKNCSIIGNKEKTGLNSNKIFIKLVQRSAE